MSIRNIDKGYYKNQTKETKETLHFMGAVTKDVDAIFTEMNGVVTVEIPSFISNAAGGEATFLCNIPLAYQSDNLFEVAYPVLVTNNEVEGLGKVFITHNQFTFFHNIAGDMFTAGQPAGLPHTIVFSFIRNPDIQEHVIVPM